MFLPSLEEFGELLDLLDGFRVLEQAGLRHVANCFIFTLQII